MIFSQDTDNFYALEELFLNIDLSSLPDEGMLCKDTFQGIGSGCDEEASRVIKLMPKWIPGMYKGKKHQLFIPECIDRV
jgi:hypothetical protein